MAKYHEWLTDEGMLKLEGWARDGLTDEQIAEKMGITASTLYAWKAKFPEFSKSLKKGKEVVDIQVENALLKRALGYSYTEITKEAVYGPDLEKTELKVTKTVTKEVAPDTTAQIFWLKNRRPDKWRDVQKFGLEKETLAAVKESVSLSDKLAAIAEARAFLGGLGDGKERE